MDDTLLPVRAKINANGRIVLPAKMRAAIGVKAGDEVLVRVMDGELRVYTVQNAIRHAQETVRRYLKPGTGSLVEALIRERREEARREEREGARDRRVRAARQGK